MDMKMKMKHDAILVRREEGGLVRPVAHVSPGGIELPDGENDSAAAVVVALGPGKLGENGERQPMSVKVGERVIFAAEATPLLVNGRRFYVIKDWQVIAVLGDEHVTVKDQMLLTSN